MKSTFSFSFIYLLLKKIMLKIGDKIPNINVTTHKGETMNLGDLKGKKLFYSFILVQIHLVYSSKLQLK